MHESAHQPVTGIHGKEDESGISLGSLIQFGKNTVKTEAMFGVSATTLNGISFTEILILFGV